MNYTFQLHIIYYKIKRITENWEK